MNKSVFYLLSVCFLFVSACGSQPIPTQPPITETVIANQEQDPCSPENLPAAVEAVNNVMREFDAASPLASDLTSQQLADLISNLQRIRRDAQDVQIPSCLGTLKTYQLNHMELTIQTLIAFIGAGDQEALNQGLEMARQEHDLYSLEIARLLGITPAPVTATPP